MNIKQLQENIKHFRKQKAVLTSLINQASKEILKLKVQTGKNWDKFISDIIRLNK